MTLHSQDRSLEAFMPLSFEPGLKQPPPTDSDFEQQGRLCGHCENLGKWIPPGIQEYMDFTSRAEPPPTEGVWECETRRVPITHQTSASELQRSATYCQVCASLWDHFISWHSSLADTARKFGLRWTDDMLDLSTFVKSCPPLALHASATLVFQRNGRWPAGALTGPVTIANYDYRLQIIFANKGFLPETYYEAPLQFHPKEHLHGMDPSMVSLPLYLQGRKEDELPYHGPPRKLAKHTSSEQCFELTRGFIADCVNNHPRCRRTIRGSREDGRPDGPYLPRRLLRIPQPNVNRASNHNLTRYYNKLFKPSSPVQKKRKKTGVIVRLVETASIEAETKKGMKYASLSYCWGNANVHKPFLLTKATHAALVAGVDVSLLPRTIQHAILATAWLGLEWLWVDSLCIVQDCSQDWAEQAPLMMSVYNEAFVTLAAVAAKGSDDGLFAERDPRTYLECPVFRDDAMNTTFTMPPRCKKGKMWDDWDWPLWDRGWVLQERVMARRTIKFGAFLGWDCCKMERDEFDYRKTMEVYRYRSAKPPLCARLATLTQRLPPPAQAADASEMYNFWIDVLTEYTSAKLTVRTDRLVAISGIIEAIHQETGWENVAGIWLPFIHLDLCWKRAPDRYKSRLSQWPTWSWASVESRLESNERNSGNDAKRLFNQHVPLADIVVASEYHSERDSTANSPLTVTENWQSPSGSRCKLQIRCIPMKVYTHRDKSRTGDDLKIYVQGLIWGEWVTLDIEMDLTGLEETITFLPLFYSGASNPHRLSAHLGNRRQTALEVSGLLVIPSQKQEGVYERICCLKGMACKADALDAVKCFKDREVSETYYLV